MRFWIWILIFWISIIIGSGLGFYYLSYRPNMMLWAEEFHPSNAYQRGRELKEEGKLAEALAAYRSGCRFFEQIAQQTQMRQHRLQYVQGLLEQALIWKEYNDVPSLQEALHLYTQATHVEPRYAEGEPWLAKGTLLQTMGKFQDSIQAFTRVFENGSALTAVDAAFGRGTSHFHLGDLQNAGLDWYRYIRYKGSLSLNAIKVISALPVESSTNALYIHARLSSEMGGKGKAIQFWQEYLAKNPMDRSARFYNECLVGNPGEFKEETIALSDFFPQEVNKSFAFSSALVDLYAFRSMRVEITMELSLAKTDSQPAQLKLTSNGQPISSLTVHSIDRGLYAVETVLQPGLDLIGLQVVQNEQSPAVTSIDLHSFTVRLKSIE